MKKIILLLIISFSFFSEAYATKHNCIDEHAVRYVKNRAPLNNDLQESLRNKSSWKNFHRDHGKWYVIFNEQNQKPHKSFGEPFEVPGSTISDKVQNLILNDFSGFGIPSDIRLKHEIKGERYLNLIYNQYYDNLEVINSKLYVKFLNDGKVAAFGLDVFSDINISTKPIISSSDALISAKQNITEVITSSSIEDELKILAIPLIDKYDYRLIYQVYFETKIHEGPAHYRCYIDAHTGELLMRKNEVMYEAPPSVPTHVSGVLYTTHPYNPSSQEDLVNLKVIDLSTGTNYYTDNSGNANLPMPAGVNVEYKLEGQYADVRTNSSTPSFTSVLGNTNNVSFDNTNSTIQERTAYYAVNRIHAHLKSIFPTFIDLDIPLETNVDESGTCNAFFNGSSINFYSAGLSANGVDYCEATAKLVDVVYHEYGHAINGNLYIGSSWSGNMSNGALNEGYADIWSFTITEDPILGIGFYQNNPNGYVRRYDVNKKVYPQDLVGEVHADGEIIAGAFWDTYLNLGNNMQQTIDLFKYTFGSGIDGPDGDEGTIYTDILVEVLFADDNDGNLSNGTPNDLAIIQAFASHGITLISNAVINHNPISSVNSVTPISINANIPPLTYPWALAAANCYYRLNTDTNWLTVPMVASGTNYVAQLPAQPSGSIIAYYIGLEDNYGMEAGVTPFKASFSPIGYANLPYFILVDYELVEEEDFDFNFGNWITFDALDNATTGLWEIGVPIGSFTDDGDIVQTDQQHTLGGIQCAYTGNASSTSSSIGENDIDGGHTTLYSPIYDMNDYIDPAFSYWRWFTNNTGAEPNADWWQVKITDDGVNWKIIENNLTSDISWRRVAFRAKDFVSLSSNNVQIKFVASDSAYGALSGGSLVEAAVDDLYLWDSSNSTSLDNLIDSHPIDNELVKITDVLGRLVRKDELNNYSILLYVYKDGTVRKHIVIK